MGALTAANGSALSWVDVEQAPFTTAGYSPVMALAQNHVHFLDVPGVPAGSADIFVIHCLFAHSPPHDVYLNYVWQSLGSSQNRRRTRYLMAVLFLPHTDRQRLSSNHLA